MNQPQSWITMKFFYSFLLVLAGFGLLAQQAAEELPPMSDYDKTMLSQLPEFTLSQQSLRRTLPDMVDNSTYNYFRPLVAQVGLECGQASSIGIMFTYEINRIRGANGSLPENQYPTHFAYNFLNNGSDAGVNYYETFEILRQVGTPNVADYGGMAEGGPSRWISGYEAYYNGMHNRIHQVYSIKTDTEVGLQTLKNWIYDHGNGEMPGGMATFYANFSYPPLTLPEGTPEAGKHVIIQWGNSPNHAMTIVGYNDSIRWDYNNDGQYTNHIDINLDGVVDLKDWEVGGFKMANTYGSISGWGDDGFSYMMYKSVADGFQQGGIWDNRVAIVDVKENHEPQLTAKIHMNHNCRNKIKVSVGMSTDLQADEPEFILNYPIFDFQGGCMAMQGNNGVPGIEFGLDLNAFLMHLEPGQTARYFLMVYENDPLSQSVGAVNSFSLMDYTGIPTEILCENSDVPLIDNGLTMMTIDAAVNFDPVVIDEESLPALKLYEPFEAQLDASGGEGPYYWSLVHNYQYEELQTDFPVLSDEVQLNPSNNNDGTVAVNLPFEFPFYGKNYATVYMSVDGFLRFEEGLSPWPYYIEGRTYLKQNKLIAPALSKPFYVVSSNGDGLWVDAKADSVSFRWKVSVSGQTGQSDVNMIASLFPDGTIKFYYGEHLAASFVKRYAGIAAGDGENFIDLNPVGTFKPQAEDHYRFENEQNYLGISLTEAGMLSLLVEDFTPELAVNIQAMDQNNVRSRTTLTVPVEGVRLDYVTQSGDDQQIDFGETFSLNLTIQNLNAFNLSSGVLSLSSADDQFTIIQDEFAVPSLSAGEVLELSDVFAVEVSHEVPDGYQAEFILSLATSEDSWSRPITLEAYNAEIEAASLLVDDGDNGILDPGDEAELIVILHNAGGASLHEVQAVLSCDNPDLIITQSNASSDFLAGNSSWEAAFSVELSENALPMEVLELILEITTLEDYEVSLTIPLMTSLILENFETANFQLFEWDFEGQEDWFITDEVVYEGNYSARSGVIGDDFFSALVLDYQVPYDDSISFYYKVSSEANYDFFKFYVNNQVLVNIAGEHDWTAGKFPVPAGEHVFKWIYEKDYSVSNGSDCVWLDYIIFPARTVVTDISETPTASKLNMDISPNPASNKVWITVDAPISEKLQLIVIDQFGNQVYGKSVLGDELKQGFNIDLSNWSSGVYTIIVNTKTQKLVKQLIRF